MKNLVANAHLVLGTDLVCLPRVQLAYQHYGERFLARLLTPDELAYCRQRRSITLINRVGARIAAKEATAKALGIGLCGLGYADGITWHDVRLESKYGQTPRLALSDRALAEANRLGVQDWYVSVSHDGDYAMATVIGWQYQGHRAKTIT